MRIIQVRVFLTSIVIGVIASRAEAAGPLDYYPALMDTLMGGYYAAAHSICDQIESQFPRHPAVLHARATVLYSHMIDMEDTVGREEFIALEDSCGRRCDELARMEKEDAVLLDYLKGSSYSTRGLLLLHDKNIFGGLRLLMAAKGAFDSAIEQNPEFYDAYLGRGAYRVAVARNAASFKWLPIIPSEESGWEDLWLTVEHSDFSRYSALSAMVWFALEDRNFSLADSICQLGLSRFPGSRGFLWPKLSLEVRQNRWAEAEQVAKELLAEYQHHPDNNGYETTGLLCRMMICADSLGRPDDAVAYAEEGLKAYRTPEMEQRRKDKLSEMNARVARKNPEDRHGREQ